MVQTLTIRRKGSFWITTVPGTPHCGIRDRFQMSYLFSLCANAECLTVKGFLFDQMMVDTTLKALANTPVSISCEKLSLQFSQFLFQKILVENANVSKEIVWMELKLSPMPEASITYRYER